MLTYKEFKAIAPDNIGKYFLIGFKNQINPSFIINVVSEDRIEYKSISKKVKTWDDAKDIIKIEDFTLANANISINEISGYNRFEPFAFKEDYLWWF